MTSRKTVEGVRSRAMANRPHPFDAPDFPLERRVGPWSDDERRIVAAWWAPRLRELRRQTDEGIAALKRYAERGRDLG
jgi:hypothetical protein